MDYGPSIIDGEQAPTSPPVFSLKMPSELETLRKRLQEAEQLHEEAQRREQEAERLREEEQHRREEDASTRKTDTATNTELEKLHYLSFSTLAIPTSIWV
jgi:hypothetical protein